MTRAKEKLYLTCANQRMLFGRTSSNRPSRFVEEIPPEHLERTGRYPFSAPEEESWGGMPSRTSGYGGYGGTERWSWSGHDSYGGRSAAQGGRASGGQTSYGGFTQAMGGAGRTVSRSEGVKRPLGGGLAAPGSAAASVPAFQKGDTVRHTAFGRGMILSVQKMGGDALVEIAFDGVGTKRLMLKSAAAHMEKLS